MHLVTARASDSCLMLDYVRVINFFLFIFFLLLFHTSFFLAISS